jgi:hypothetical protein
VAHRLGVTSVPYLSVSMIVEKEPSCQSDTDTYCQVTTFPRCTAVVQRLGVTSVQVDRSRGLDWRALQEGIRRFRQANGSRARFTNYFAPKRPR